MFIVWKWARPSTQPIRVSSWKVSYDDPYSDSIASFSKSDEDTATLFLYFWDGIYWDPSFGLDGSGGFMGDLVFNGGAYQPQTASTYKPSPQLQCLFAGKYGMFVGNQQFTVRNVTFNNAQSAVFQAWNWAWTFQGITVNNCQVHSYSFILNDLSFDLIYVNQRLRLK